MFMTLKRAWDTLDATSGEAVQTTIPAGRHEIERIKCPVGHDCNWLVLKGTLIGGSEGSWRQWINGSDCYGENHPKAGQPIDWKEFEVVIEE
jgi:hypothetical protein